jgi:hypothetical protein
MCKKLLLGFSVALLMAGAACKIEHTRTVDDEGRDGRYIEHNVRIAEPFTGDDHGVDVYHSKRPDHSPDDHRD